MFTTNWLHSGSAVLIDSHSETKIQVYCIYELTTLYLLQSDCNGSICLQIRHGAGTGLREILKSYGASGGKLVGCTAEQVLSSWT